MRNLTSSCALVVILALTFFGIGGAQYTSVPSCTDTLSLRISTPDTVVAVGDRLPLRVEIQNCGQSEVWIALSYEENLGFPANLLPMVRDRHRRRVLPNASILVGGLGKPPYEWWVRLPPGYFYGRDVMLTKYESAFVDRPGKYEILVSYAGIDRPRPPGNPSKSRASASTPPEGASIFAGRVESNSVWVEVVAPGASKP